MMHSTQKLKGFAIPGAILVACLLNLHFGLRTHNPLLTMAGTVGLCYVMVNVAGINRKSESPVLRPRLLATLAEPLSPAERMAAEQRYPLLLTLPMAAELADAAFRRALEGLRQAMALVPQGQVALAPSDTAGATGCVGAAQGTTPGTPLYNTLEPGTARIVSVEPYFLDRYPVTNRLYYEFVHAGGYREKNWWDDGIWTAVPNMVDSTGLAGPRFWSDGRYAPGEEDLPVVGVSWYEAAACARWFGKRLPSDAEWVKAGAAPVPVPPHMLSQRRYPWGDAMDRRRANLWGSGPNRIVPVLEFPDGGSVGGIYHLIGNVWEWTSGSLGGDEPGAAASPLTGPRRSIRGGAFDTYFDNQATCQFQSGENPLQRRHNLGFRCAVSLKDLVLSRPEGAAL